MVKPGEAGELIVDASAETFFSGYLNRPDATAEKLRNGCYFTGDVCVMHENGDMDLVGRVDDVIRSGGESVYPEEVEALLASHPSVGRPPCLVFPILYGARWWWPAWFSMDREQAGRRLTPIADPARSQDTKGHAPI
jgi:acyl-CoA synthetase (AMP-forming)/AMP-acid ligase II